MALHSSGSGRRSLLCFCSGRPLNPSKATEISGFQTPQHLYNVLSHSPIHAHIHTLLVETKQLFTHSVHTKATHSRAILGSLSGPRTLQPADSIDSNRRTTRSTPRAMIKPSGLYFLPASWSSPHPEACFQRRWQLPPSLRTLQ